MKANEIQIGDWVYSTFCNKPCKVVGVEQYESGYANVKVTNVSGAKDITSLTPIPLTTEILEKNGFVESKEKAILEDIGCTIIYGKYERLDSDNYLNYGDNLYPIKYIHQLQHALRLCGIEKEIEL